MKTAADSPVVQHLFIYFCLEINFNPLSVDEGTFLSCCPMRNNCPNRYIYTFTIVWCIFLDKIFTSRLWNNSIHVSILNNSKGAFKKEKEKEIQTKAVYLLNKLHMESIVTAQSQNLFILKTWNSSINIPLLDAFVLKWILKVYKEIKIHRRCYLLEIHVI